MSHRKGEGSWYQHDPGYVLQLWLTIIVLSSFIYQLHSGGGSALCYLFSLLVILGMGVVWNSVPLMLVLAVLELTM